MSEKNENSVFFLPDFVTSCYCNIRSFIQPSDNNINDDNVYNDIDDYNDVINDKRYQLNRHFKVDQSPNSRPF